MVIMAALAISLVIGLSRSCNSTSVAAAGVIAWNPSHQDDTGRSGWHEYAICGDIAKRTMKLLPGFKNVLCWRTDMGLASSDAAALKAECEKASAARAQVFIALHVDGGAASGVSGYYCEGDSTSAHYAETLLRSVATSMGMAFLAVKPRSDLLVLEPANNKARIRVLLELGDNVADRKLLSSAKGRQRLAAALAKALKENAPSAFR
jgi:N-acetylmuramoyl-L-alanine amidase